MNLCGISHRCADFDAAGLDKDHLHIRLHANKDIDQVILYADDPYTNPDGWIGYPQNMTKTAELEQENLWEITVHTKYHRLQYYFDIYQGDQHVYLLEDGFYTPENLHQPWRYNQYFKFGYLNPADIITPPKWVKDTVWYQIFPDRFFRDEETTYIKNKSCYFDQKFKDWNDTDVTWKDVYGGTIRGITEKLDYIKELGVSGIYLTPIFASFTNHKYNTTDYETIDPDFGTEEDFKELVEQAHQRNIRVMIDAVFNHTGHEFFAWKDIQEKGKDSKYWDWYWIEDDYHTKWDTSDKSYDTFAFAGYMPKLNTNNPEVQDYLTNLADEWVKKYDVDGIRFDVGNEISHSLVKKIRRELKDKFSEKDLFLLGEIWTDSKDWMSGDEYDSVMNYPWTFAVRDFYADKNMPVRIFIQKMNRVYSLYAKQSNPVLFNFLDTHDFGRIASLAADDADLMQMLALLFLLPGTPCLFYGTELAIEGDHDPICRKPMPWNEISTPENQERIHDIKILADLKKSRKDLHGDELRWLDIDINPENSRMIAFARKNICIYINAGAAPAAIDIPSDASLLFSSRYENNEILPGGILVYESDRERS